MLLTELRTPAVLVEFERVRSNIARMQSTAAAHGLRLRPHAKTHKSPQIARWQLDAGAVGLCCAKLGEAEVFADAGVTDIRLPYPLQPTNADRVFALLDRGVRLSFIVDQLATAQAWSSVAQAAARTVDVLVKVDVGFHRCGIDPGDPGAVDLVATIAGLPGLRVLGLLSHAGQAYSAASDEALAAIVRDESATLGRLAEALRARGVAVPELSVGSTPTAKWVGESSGLTEMRPGNYVYFDRTQVALGSAALTDCALTVLSTVVTVHGDRVILDAGSKTLTSDLVARPGHPGYGAIFRDGVTMDALDDRLVIERLSEEHATVRVTGGEPPLKPGDRVRILPNHSCPVSNLADQVALVSGTHVIDGITVAARGKNS